MLSRLYKWWRWVTKVDWIYSGDEVRPDCNGSPVVCECWLNVHTHEEKFVIIRAVDQYDL